MGSAPQAPAPPDPTQTAQAQGAANIDTAEAQQVINSTNQVTPYGTVDYTHTGGSFIPTLGGGQQYIPQYTATTALSPGMQKLFDTSLQGSQGAADLRNTLQGNAAGVLSKPLDLGWNATQANLDKLNRNTLDPQWAQSQKALDQQLANQGLTPGSEGWNYQQNQFGLNKSNAYNNMYLQGQAQSAAELEAQYNSPINALSALESQSQVSQPGIGQLAPTPQEQIAPPNYQAAVQANQQQAMQQYQAQLQSSNQMTSGLMGIGGSLLGGLFQSDRRDKTDIEKLGKDPKTGLPVFSYRYKEDPKTNPKVVGVMAQDVEKVHPGSTEEIGGHMVIKPSAAAKFGLGGQVASAVKYPRDAGDVAQRAAFGIGGHRRVA